LPAADQIAANGLSNRQTGVANMFRKILIFGLIAGLIVGLASFSVTVAMAGQPPPLEYGMLFGYTSMLVALSLVFVGIKRHRDLDLGGVIRFWPALGMGLGISFIASLFYVLAWEAALAVTGMNFIDEYARFLIDQQKAQGASAAALAKLSAEMEQFKLQYANPLFRLPMTFAEMFPVGVLVSAVAAGLLRNPRFLAARRA